MAAEAQAGRNKSKRTSNACIACRQSKIKCSGEDPCANCQRRGVECQFAHAHKVMVDERYLQEVLNQAKHYQTVQQEPSPGLKRRADEAFGPPIQVDPIQPDSTYPDAELEQEALPQYQTIDQEQSVYTNPFTLPSRTIQGSYRGRRDWIWLAPTSLWSLTTRLSLMMTENLHLESPYKVPSFLDKEVYPLRWLPTNPADPPDVSGLPSIDDALHLLNIFKYHLHQTYSLFDENSFMRHLREFYSGNSQAKATENRLWFMQFLLVLAFGNAFLLRPRKSNDPPGSKFFLRAISLMPDHTTLWTGGLLAIEVLALSGLYLYSLDHRESAHVYVGQAIRIAQLDGLHTELPEKELGIDTVTRCRNLWWTLYVMDRHISSSLGLPMTTHDSDITTVLDHLSMGPRQDATLGLHAKLSYMFSSILSSIYRTETTELGTFLEKTRAILQNMTAHAQEIEGIVDPDCPNSVEAMPKGTRHVTLLYHQCVIAATRPLLLSVLKGRLERLGRRDEDWQGCLAPTKALISTGIKSASKTLQILSDENSLLEVFLPFELEFAYGAAIHLLMANTLFPHATEHSTYSEEPHSIFDEMICKGNRLASSRKTEFAHLEGLFRELVTRTKQHGIPRLTLYSPELCENNLVEGHPMGGHHAGDPVIDPALSAPATLEDPGTSADFFPTEPNNAGLLDEIGISSCEFLSIINQIDDPGDCSVLDPAPPWQ